MKFGFYLPMRGRTATPEALNESLGRMGHFTSVIKPAADRLRVWGSRDAQVRYSPVSAAGGGAHEETFARSR